MRIASLIMAAAAAFALQSEPASAQTSEQDLLKRFETHRSTHRGLSLSPVASTGATMAGTATAATQAGSQGSSNVAATTESAQPRTSGTTVTPVVEYVRMPEDSQINITIEFDYDSATLRASEYGKLEALCNAINASDIGLFRIFGHTDAAGSAQYNLGLSQRRAEEVRRHMVAACRIDGRRLQAIGVGKAYPLIGSNPLAPENRRVEFQAIG